VADLHGMLAENRPEIKSTISHVNEVSEKLGPLLARIQSTVDQANVTLKKIDGIVDENKEDLRSSIVSLRQTLNNVSALTAQIQTLLDNNDYNIEELLNNLRLVSENLKEFTDAIKTRPSTLIDPKGPRDRKPGDKP
jgi:ABC-type transporter Mla subunit MlaD